MTVLLISFIVKSCQSISINCPLLMLALWACGQRACVVHHVHSEDARRCCRFVDDAMAWSSQPST